MSFASVDKAVGAALLGVSPGVVLPQVTGYSSAAFDGQAGRVANTSLIGKRKVTLNGLPTEIPIYRFSTRGKRLIETFPCISYEIVGMQFNPERYVWPGDQFRTPVKSSYVTATLSDGTTAEGPSLRAHRNHPDPWDLMVEIRTWSKAEHGVESMILQKLILESFPWHGGALSAVLLDGSSTSYEMYGTSMNNVDADESALDNPAQREFSWVMTYIVETFLDNTLDVEYKRTLTTPVEIETESQD